MELEKKLVAHIVGARLERFPKQDVDIARNMILTNLGTIVAGATAEGCQALVGLYPRYGRVYKVRDENGRLGFGKNIERWCKDQHSQKRQGDDDLFVHKTLLQE